LTRGLRRGQWGHQIPGATWRSELAPCPVSLSLARPFHPFAASLEPAPRGPLRRIADAGRCGRWRAAHLAPCGRPSRSSPRGAQRPPAQKARHPSRLCPPLGLSCCCPDKACWGCNSVDGDGFDGVLAKRGRSLPS
jgi:hypothetical protein